MWNVKGFLRKNTEKAPLSRRFSYLATSSIAIAAAATVAAAQPAAVITAATEQDQQDDDPAHIATAGTVITHRRYLQEIVAAYTAHSKIFRSRKNVRRAGIGFLKDRRGAEKIPPAAIATEGIWEAWIISAACYAANPCRIQNVQQ